MHFQIFSDKQQECDLPIYGGGSSTTGASSGLNNTGSSEVTASVSGSIGKAKSKSNSEEEVLKTEDQTLPLPSKCFRKLSLLMTGERQQTTNNVIIIIDVLQLNVMLTGSNKHVSIHSPSSDIGPMSVISGVKSTPPTIHSEAVEENKSASKPLSRFGVDTEHEAELEKVCGEKK